jgi:hypothetical protein
MPVVKWMIRKPTAKKTYMFIKKTKTNIQFTDTIMVKCATKELLVVGVC